MENFAWPVCSELLSDFISANLKTFCNVNFCFIETSKNMTFEYPKIHIFDIFEYDIYFLLGFEKNSPEVAKAQL